jgi:nucleotide-binding universal stress UspA family protein
VEWARRLPLPDDARYLVVSVVPPPALPHLPDWETTERQARVHAAHEAIDEACALFGASVEGRLAEGDPREAIVAAATEWAADLIVLGARGLGAVKEVLRGLPLPSSTRLRLIGVAEPVRFPPPVPEILGGALRGTAAEMEHERRAALERTLAPEAAALRARVATVNLTVTVGLPAPEILRYADITDTDLIVLGARGLGIMKRLVLGSVSEAVLRHAGCPVLIVRGRA